MRDHRKIGIPDAILLKEGTADARRGRRDEALIRRIGYDILKGSRRNT